MYPVNTIENLNTLDLMLSSDFFGFLDSIPGLIQWIAQETSGSVALAKQNGVLTPTFDGTIVSATVAQPFTNNIPLAYLYDANNDLVKIQSSALNTIFDGDAGTVTMFLQSNSWSAAFSYALGFDSSATNRFAFRRPNISNAFQVFRGAAGVSRTATISPITTLNPVMITSTWDVSAGVNGELKIYLNDSLEDTTTNLAAWTGGALQAGTTNIGAFNNTPAQFVWNGKIGPILYNPTRAMALAEIVEIYQRWVR